MKSLVIKLCCHLYVKNKYSFCNKMEFVELNIAIAIKNVNYSKYVLYFKIIVLYVLI